MRRYYFDLIDAQGLSVDDEGLECSDTQQVQAEAARALADLAREAIHEAAGGLEQRMAISVRDDDGPVMEVEFSFEIHRSLR